MSAQTLLPGSVKTVISGDFQASTDTGAKPSSLPKERFLLKSTWLADLCVLRCLPFLLYIPRNGAPALLLGNSAR